MHIQDSSIIYDTNSAINHRNLQHYARVLQLTTQLNTAYSIPIYMYTIHA